jgi:hypothetical protein
MGCERFDIGIKRDAGDMILSEGQGASRSSKPSSGSATRTPNEPTSTSDPLAVTVLSLIDDLTIQAIERMKAEGFEPAIIVETLPNNFHAWVNHGRVLETATSTLNPTTVVASGPKVINDCHPICSTALRALRSAYSTWR